MNEIILDKNTIIIFILKGKNIMSEFHNKSTAYVSDVNLKVKNLDASINFYQLILGLKVLERTVQKAVMTADGKTPLIILEQPNDVEPKTGRTSGLYHYALLLPSRADLSVFLRHLLQTGYPFGAADHLVSEALYLNDIDGNGIEVYRDRPASEWTWKDGLVDMATIELDGNGILAENNDEWEGLSPGTIMGHIHLHVSDLIAAKEFYTKGLGFEIVSYYPQAVFLSTGKYHHHIAINTWQGVGVPAPAKNNVGLNWYKIVYPTAEEREQAVSQLRQMGAKVDKGEDYYITEDPSGNQIRLVL